MAARAGKGKGKAPARTARRQEPDTEDEEDEGITPQVQPPARGQIPAVFRQRAEEAEQRRARAQEQPGAAAAAAAAPTDLPRLRSGARTAILRVQSARPRGVAEPSPRVRVFHSSRDCPPGTRFADLYPRIDPSRERVFAEGYDGEVDPQAPWSYSIAKELRVLPPPIVSHNAEQPDFTTLESLPDESRIVRRYTRAEFIDRFTQDVKNDLTRNGDRTIRIYVFKQTGAVNEGFYEQRCVRPEWLLPLDAEQWQDVDGRLQRIVNSAERASKSLFSSAIAVFSSDPRKPFTHTITRSWRGAEITVAFRNVAKVPLFDVTDEQPVAVTRTGRVTRVETVVRRRGLFSPDMQDYMQTRRDQRANPPMLDGRPMGAPATQWSGAAQSSLWRYAWDVLRQLIAPGSSFKFSISMFVVISHTVNGNERFKKVYIGPSHFGHRTHQVDNFNPNSPTGSSLINTIKEIIVNGLEQYENYGMSQVVIEYIDTIFFSVYRVQPLQSVMRPGRNWMFYRQNDAAFGAPGSFIETPADIASRRGAVLNIRNIGDERCLEYSILASQYVYRDEYTPRIMLLDEDIVKAEGMPGDSAVLETLRAERRKLKRAHQTQQERERRIATSPDTYADPVVFHRENHERWQQMKELWAYYRIPYNVPEPVLLNTSMLAAASGRDGQTGISPFSQAIQRFETVNRVSLFIFAARDGKRGIRRKGADGVAAEDAHVIVPLRRGAVFHDEITNITRTYPTVIRLLLISQETRSHYLLIRSMSSLLHGQLNPSHNGRSFLCDTCLKPLSSQQAYDNHVQTGCMLYNKTPTKLPSAEQGHMEFDREWTRERVPWFVAADTECMLLPEEDNPDSDVLNSHVPHSIGLILASPCFPEERTVIHVNHNPEELMKSFASTLLDYQAKILMRVAEMQEKYREYTEQALCYDFCGRCGEDFASDGELRVPRFNERTGVFMGAQHKDCDGYYDMGDGGCGPCYLCGKPLTVRDKGYVTHNYWDNGFSGLAHQTCQSKRRIVGLDSPLVVYFHNGTRYDFHFVIANAGVFSGAVSVIHNNSEKFMCVRVTTKRFSKRFKPYAEDSSPKMVAEACVERVGGLNIEFRDSIALGLPALATAVDRLVGSVRGDTSAVRMLLPFTSRENPDDAQFEVRMEKGHFPYEYCDSLARYEEPCLPPPEAFASKLTGSPGLEAEDYAMVQRQFRVFGCSNLGDFEREYLKTDVSLLADCIAAFQETALKSKFGLDPLWFLTAPGYAWVAMLWTTKVRLQLFTAGEMDKYMFWQSMIRGGLCGPVKRFASSNDPANQEHYIPDEEQRCIKYYDANALYASVMWLQALPVRDFIWERVPEGEAWYPWLCERLTSTHGSRGYALRVDVEFPDECHDRLDEYPPLPINLPPEQEWLSTWQRDHQPSTWRPFPKLMQTLLPRQRYVVEAKELLLAIEMGAKVTAVHQIMSYHQERFMRGYIEICTEMRAKAKSESEKQFAKLMGNSVFGKFMENKLRRDTQLHIVTSEEQAVRLASNPRFISSKIIAPDKVSIAMLRPSSICLDKPIYAGAIILSESKRHMMRAFYGMKRAFGFTKDLNLIYTDTDSFILELVGDVKRTTELIEGIDAQSIYPEHPEYAGVKLMNDKIPGLFKDELKGKSPLSVTAIAPKMYAIQFADEAHEKDKLAAKGIPQRLLKEGHVKSSDYQHVVLEDGEHSVQFVRFQSIAHQIRTRSWMMRAMRNFYDKRHVCDDGLTTHAYGYKGTESHRLFHSQQDYLLVRAKQTSEVRRKTLRHQS
jgi:hypothetical protein